MKDIEPFCSIMFMLRCPVGIQSSTIVWLVSSHFYCYCSALRSNLGRIELLVSQGRIINRSVILGVSVLLSIISRLLVQFQIIKILFARWSFHNWFQQPVRCHKYPQKSSHVTIGIQHFFLWSGISGTGFLAPIRKMLRTLYNFIISMAKMLRPDRKRSPKRFV